MFNYTCRFKAQCFAKGRNSTELFRMYKYWLNAVETTTSNTTSLLFSGVGVHHMPLSTLVKCFIYSLFAISTQEICIYREMEENNLRVERM